LVTINTKKTQSATTGKRLGMCQKVNEESENKQSHLEKMNRGFLKKGATYLVNDAGYHGHREWIGGKVTSRLLQKGPQILWNVEGERSEIPQPRRKERDRSASHRTGTTHSEFFKRSETRGSSRRKRDLRRQKAQFEKRSIKGTDFRHQ